MLLWTCVVLAAVAAAPDAPAQRFLAGTVRDTAGKPVAQATVLVPPPAAPAGPASLLRTLSGGDGSFRIAVPPGPATFPLVVQAADKETVYVAKAKPAAERLALVLRPGARLEGTVLAVETGSPLADVKVTAARKAAASKDTPPIPAEVLDLLVPPAASDKRGNWAITGLGAGAYDLVLKTPGRFTSRSDAVILRLGETRRLDASLEPASAVAGVVRDADGQPLAKARVTLDIKDRQALVADLRPTLPMPRGLRGSYRVETTEDGSYLFDAVRPATDWVLAAGKKGLAPARLALTTGAGGDTVQSDVRLAAGARLSGVVIDENAAPVKSAFVELEEVASAATRDGLMALMQPRIRPLALLGPGDHPRPAPGESDGEGKFALADIRPGEYHITVFAAGKSRVSGEKIVLESGKPVTGATLRVELGKPLSGRVLNDEDEAVAGAQVFAFSSQAGDLDRASVDSEADGSFEIRGLGGERARLQVTAEGYAQSESNEVSTAATDVSIVLKRTGSIAGRLSDESGAPIAAARIEFAGSGRHRPPAMLSPGDDVVATVDGRYVRDGLEPGSGTITFRAPGFLPASVALEVLPGKLTPNVDAVLKRGGVIRGTITRAGDGQPVMGAWVSLKGRGAENGMARMIGPSREGVASDSFGHFRLEGVPAGHTQLQVSHADYAEALSDDLDVGASGGEAELRVTLSQGGAIEGLVTDADGKPRAGLRVSVSGNALGDTRSLTTAADGSFHVDRLAPGPYDVGVYDPMRPPQSSREVSAVVKEGQTTRVDFGTARGAVSGRVIQAGQPVAGASVFLAWESAFAGGAGARATSDAAGRYEFRSVDPGRYRLFAQQGRNSATLRNRVTVNVEDAPVVAPDIELYGTVHVAGRVIDAATDTPLAEVRVFASPVPQSGDAANRTGGTGPTDENGNYSFAVGEAGTYRLSTVRADFAPAMLVVDVPATGMDGVELRLERGEQLSGRVVDAEGLPVADAAIRAEWQGPHGEPLSARGKPSDGAGRFSRAVSPGVSVRLSVAASAYAPAFLPAVATSGEIVVVLARGGELAIEVQSSDEERRGMSFELRDAGGRDVLPDFRYGYGLIDTSLPWSGHIRFPHVSPGAYTLVVRSGARSVERALTIVEGTTLKLEIAF